VFLVWTGSHLLSRLAPFFVNLQNSNVYYYTKNHTNTFSFSLSLFKRRGVNSELYLPLENTPFWTTRPGVKVLRGSENAEVVWVILSVWCVLGAVCAWVDVVFGGGLWGLSRELLWVDIRIERIEPG